jgi:hypothetical protein
MGLQRTRETLSAISHTETAENQGIVYLQFAGNRHGKMLGGGVNVLGVHPGTHGRPAIPLGALDAEKTSARASNEGGLTCKCNRRNAVNFVALYCHCDRTMILPLLHTFA